jgi:hypothetical protein
MSINKNLTVMKTILNIRMSALVLFSLAAGLLASSCSSNITEFTGHQKKVAPYPDTTNPKKELYIPQAKQNPNKLKLLIIDSTYIVNYKGAYGTAPAPSDIAVSFSINQSLVDSYNNAHSTSYTILPKDSYTMGKTSATISVGEFDTPPLEIKINPKGHIKDSTKAQYLLPITITAKSGGVNANKNLQTAYFLIQGSYPLLERTNWTIPSFSSYLAYPPEKLFDGIYAGGSHTYWLTVNAMPQWVIIDMGKKQTLHGFKIAGNPNNSSGSYIDRNPKKVEFQFSDDGTNFSNGETFTLSLTSSAHHITKVHLSKSVQARYVKFSVLEVNSGVVMNVAELWAF